jgi:hypothetical protein
VWSVAPLGLRVRRGAAEHRQHGEYDDASHRTMIREFRMEPKPAEYPQTRAWPEV